MSYKTNFFVNFINFLCEQCLSDNTCDDLFGGGEDEYGRLHGTVQYIFGDYKAALNMVVCSQENQSLSCPEFDQLNDQND